MLAPSRCQIAQLTISVNNRSLVGGDGMRSMLESRANVVNARLPIFHIKRSGLEENIRPCRRQPVPHVVWFVWGRGPRLRKVRNRIRTQSEDRT